MYGLCFRFCVSVYRQHFPEDVQSKKSSSKQGTSSLPQPGHIITLMPPVRIVNLLPVDMTYYLKNTDIKGSIKPGHTAPLFAVS